MRSRHAHSALFLLLFGAAFVIVMASPFPFGKDDDQRYAELYLNIDLAALHLWLAEKDQDYRAPLIRALST